MTDRARRNPGVGRWSRWIWWGLAGVTAAWLLWMTQVPQSTAVAGLAPLTEAGASLGISSRLLIGILGNIVVFVPLGGLIARAVVSSSMRWPVGSRAALLWPWLWGTLGGGALSGTIELLQIGSASRFADWHDVALNTLGALLGSLLVAWLMRGPLRRKSSAAQSELQRNGMAR